MFLAKALSRSTALLVFAAVAAAAFAYAEHRVHRPRDTAAPFGISGTFGRLWPGEARPVDLILANPGSEPIAVTRLSVELARVSAPRATEALPCPPDNFSVTQFSGSYPLFIGPDTTVSLSGLDVPASKWPRINMLGLGVNQDGCQGATVFLDYGGSAVVR